MLITAKPCKRRELNYDDQDIVVLDAAVLVMPPRTRRTAVSRRPTAITEITEASPFKKWIVYADSGVGKTVLAGTAPDNLLLEFDPEGHESAKVAGSAAKVWPLPDWKEWQDALAYFEKGPGCQEFNWVTIDTLSEGEDVAWRYWLQHMVARKPSTRSVYKPALDDYPIVWNHMKELIEKFNRLPINVLYTAHVLELEQYDEEKEEDYTLKMPLLGSTKNGILSRKICAKVGVVGYMDVKRRRVEDDEGEETIEEYRRLYVAKRRGIVAKNRYDWPNWIDNPTMPELIALADEAGSPHTAPTPPRRRSRRTA